MTPELKEAVDILKGIKAWGNTTLIEAEKEAIDTVVAELERPLPTDREIETEAFNSISPSIWIKGAKWMRDKMMGDIK